MKLNVLAKFHNMAKKKRKITRIRVADDDDVGDNCVFLSGIHSSTGLWENNRENQVNVPFLDFKHVYIFSMA